MNVKKILIVGLGLIGGSIAKSLKLHTGHEILGLDTNEDAMLDAFSMGVIDAKASVMDIGDADIIYLSVYPDSAVAFMKAHADKLKQGCIVTDACGIKGYICEELETLAQKTGFQFVAGHPMAGKEKSGFTYSDPSIFYGASYIIVPGSASDEAVNEIAGLAEAMGFGKVVKTTAENHDKMIAFTSQVPHVLACAYVLSPQCNGHKGFSAGSYRDVSRVADINAPLWSKLFLENKTHLVEELDTLLMNLQQIKEAINNEDSPGLNDILSRAAEIKRRDNNEN